MNIEEMAETLVRLVADISRSQTSLKRCQKLNNEKILRWSNLSKTMKLKITERTIELKSASKLKKQQNENAVLMKRELEKHIRNVTEDLQHQNEILDDRLRTLELQNEYLMRLENVCETTKKTLTDYTSKNDAYKRRLKTDIEIYEQNFGVKIRILDENTKFITFQITFTQISSSNPDQEFVLIMTHDKKSTYKIVESRPPLNDLSADVKKLNDEDGLSNFLVGVRSKFKNLHL